MYCKNKSCWMSLPWNFFDRSLLCVTYDLDKQCVKVDNLKIVHNLFKNATDHIRIPTSALVWVRERHSQRLAVLEALLLGHTPLRIHLAVGRLHVAGALRRFVEAALTSPSICPLEAHPSAGEGVACLCRGWVKWCWSLTLQKNCLITLSVGLSEIDFVLLS